MGKKFEEDKKQTDIHTVYFSANVRWHDALTVVDYYL